MAIERTPEERQLFYNDRTAILQALAEVEDYEPGSDENKKAMMMLIDTLDMTIPNLVSICANLARITLEQGTVRLGPGKDAGERSITLTDIAVLRAAIRTRLKATGEVEIKETIALRRAMSRLNPVQLFYAAINGKTYRYVEKTPGRNGVDTLSEKERHFGGIPQNKLPRKVTEVRRGNMVDGISRVDLAINPDNAQRIYDILKLLETEQPEVELPVRPGGKLVSRKISRLGEANFFRDRLSPGLKPWAQPKEPKADEITT